MPVEDEDDVDSRFSANCDRCGRAAAAMTDDGTFLCDDHARQSKYGQPSYPLSQQEQEFLLSGDTGKYRRSKLTGQIHQKVGRLPLRISHLQFDIELLEDTVWVDQAEVEIDDFEKLMYHLDEASNLLHGLEVNDG